MLCFPIALCATLSNRAEDPGLVSWGEQRVLVGRRPVFSPGGPAELHAGGAGVTPQLPPHGSVGGQRASSCLVRRVRPTNPPAQSRGERSRPSDGACSGTIRASPS